jgi:hypothetical protein
MLACSPSSAHSGVQTPVDGGWGRPGRQETRRGQPASQGAGSSSAAWQGQDRRPQGWLRHGHCSPEGEDLGPSQGRPTRPRDLPPAEQRVWAKRPNGESPGRPTAREGRASARLPGQRSRCGRGGRRPATWPGAGRCQTRWSLALWYAALMCVLSALPRSSNASSCVHCSSTRPIRLEGTSVGTQPMALQGEAFPNQPLLTLRSEDGALVLNEPSGKPCNAELCHRHILAHANS